MTKVNFKNSLIALAIGLVVVSCGGGNSNKQSGVATSESNGQEAKVNLAEHYEAVEMPKVDFIEDWMLPTDGILTQAKQDGDYQWSFIVGGLNRAQYDKYLKTLETKAKKETSAMNDADFSYGTIRISTVTSSFRDDGGAMKNGFYERSNLRIYIVK
jgi:hypothetical protein